MTVKLTIENGKWCFTGVGSGGENKGFGHTMRDAQTNFNRNVDSTIYRPTLISSTIIRSYDFTQEEFEELTVAEFERKLQNWRRLRSRLGLVHEGGVECSYA